MCSTLRQANRSIRPRISRISLGSCNHLERSVGGLVSRRRRSNSEVVPDPDKVVQVRLFEAERRWMSTAGGGTQRNNISFARTS